MVRPGQSVDTPPSVLQGRDALVGFSVRDIRVLLEQGISPQESSTGLLNGLIVRKDRADPGENPLAIGRAHRDLVEKLSRVEGTDPTPLASCCRPREAVCVLPVQRRRLLLRT